MLGSAGGRGPSRLIGCVAQGGWRPAPWLATGSAQFVAVDRLGSVGVWQKVAGDLLGSVGGRRPAGLLWWSWTGWARRVCGGRRLAICPAQLVAVGRDSAPARLRGGAMTPPRCSAHPPLLSPPKPTTFTTAACFTLDVARTASCFASSATCAEVASDSFVRRPGALRVPPLELRSVLRARRRRRCVLRCTRRPACREARPLCFVQRCARASAARLAHHVSCDPCGTGADAFACGLHSAPWCANNGCTVQLLSTGDYPTVALFPRVLPFDDAPARCERCEPRLD